MSSLAPARSMPLASSSACAFARSRPLTCRQVNGVTTAGLVWRACRSSASSLPVRHPLADHARSGLGPGGAAQMLVGERRGQRGQILIVVTFNFQPARPLTLTIHTYLALERALEGLDQGLHMWIGGLGYVDGRGRRLAPGGGDLLGPARRKLVRRDLPCRRKLFAGRCQTQQRACLADTQFAVLDLRQDRLGQLKQPHRVAHVWSALADPLGDLFVAERKFPRQALQTARFLDRVQIFAGQILHQGDFQRPFVIELAHHNRNLGQTGLPRRPQPPLARYQPVMRGPVAVLDWPHDQRLDNPLCRNRLGQLRHPLGIELASRLKERGRDRIYRYFAISAGGARRDNSFQRILDQRAQAPSQWSARHFRPPMTRTAFHQRDTEPLVSSRGGGVTPSRSIISQAKSR